MAGAYKTTCFPLDRSVGAPGNGLVKLVRRVQERAGLFWKTGTRGSRVGRKLVLKLLEPASLSVVSSLMLPCSESKASTATLGSMASDPREESQVP